MYKLDEDGRLDVSEMGLTSLDELPVGIKHLNCYDNKLTSLPELPSSLIFLQCGMNKIEVLPKLPNGLRELYCSNNNLKTLGKLPETLNWLSCHHNPIESLIDIRFVKHRLNWIMRYYFPYINSYEGQKNILSREPWMLDDLVEQLKLSQMKPIWMKSELTLFYNPVGLLDSIREEFSYLINGYELNLL